MKILDGKALSQKILKKLKEQIQNLPKRTPGLIFFLIGDNPASLAYVRMKKKACIEVGIHSEVVQFEKNVDEKTLLQQIIHANSNPSIDGILVQMPLPPHIDSQKITSAIDPKKDVDGFHPMNMGKLLLGQEDGLIACTPLGIHTLLINANISFEKKHVVILGRSSIVGKPLAALLIQKKENYNATVTIAHSMTTNLSSITQSADILITALGKANFIKKEMVKQNVVVVDVGISRIQKENKAYLVGDVDFKNVCEKCSYITPVPGGVGPMTIAMLMKNTYKSFLQCENTG